MSASGGMGIALDDAIVGVVEFSMLMVDFMIATMFGILIWKTKTIHLHLRMIFLNMVVATYGECVTRVWLTILVLIFPDSLKNPSVWTAIIEMCPGMFASYLTFIEISIAVERLIATFSVKNYEKSFNKLLFLNIAVPWTLNIGVVYMTTYKIIFTSYSYFSYLLVCINIFTWICFFILYQTNRQMYAIKRFENIKLTEKYQISENIRTTKLLTIFVMFTALRNSGGVLYMLLNAYYYYPNKLSTRTIDYAYRLFLALFFGLYPFVLIGFHKDLRKLFRRRILRVSSSLRIFNKVSAQNVIGQQLYTNFEEVDYFQGLKHQWNTKYKQSRGLS